MKANALHNKAESLAAGLPKLLIAAERLAFAASPGLHGRRRAGPGDSFWQFRDWREGDDTKQIDWRRSAKGETHFIREREWDAQAGIALSLQNTRGMAFSSNKNLPSKHERAALLLLALTALLLRSGERVALANITPPLSGHAALPEIAAALVAGGTSRTDPQTRRVVFGDFLIPNPVFTAPPGGAVMQILDPAESDFPYQGRIIFEGFGSEKPLEAADAADWAAPYRARLAAQHLAITQAAQTAGQTPLFHRTDAAPAPALAALYRALQK